MPVAASASAQSATTLVSQQLRVQQAQRSADQAELAARALRQQASVAQREADRSQESARSLNVSADAALGRAGAARQQLASMSSLEPVQAGFETIRSQIAEGFQALDTAAAAPVVNAEGQTTGTLVNVTA